MRVRRAEDPQRPRARRLRLDIRSVLKPREFVAAAWDAWRVSRLGPDAVAARGRDRFARLVAFARARSRFYADLYDGLPNGVDAPGLLPPVTRRDLAERFDDFATDPAVTRAGAEAFAADEALSGRLYLGRYAVWTTSGTTGRPAVLVTDRHALAVYAALAAVRHLPARLSAAQAREIARRGRRVATVLTTGGPFASAVVGALFARHFPRLSRNSRHFSIMDPLPALARALERFDPAVIGGYPTALSLLAAEQAAGRLSLRPVAAMTGAEWLSPPARAQIGSAFGCPVIDTYAASEFMGIAFECRHARLHVNSDRVLLEPVDGERRPVPPGKPSSTVLLTNLANRVVPIIRYDLGDSVTAIPDRCACGSPFPAIAVEGRRNAIFAFRRAPGGDRASVLPMALATVIEDIPGVRSYQVIQEGAARILVRLEPSEDADREAQGERLLRDLRAYLARQGLSWVEAELSPDPPAREPESGKLRQFIALPE